MDIIARPPLLSPGYNPMYIYGTSSVVNSETNFSYKIFIADVDRNDILSARTIVPDDDDKMVSDINRLLAGRLGDLTDDININTNTNVFNNTPSSGYRYNVLVREQFLDTWDFTAATVSTFLSDQVVLLSPEPNNYVTGDIIIVDGISTVLDFTSITQGVNGFVRINLSTPHNLSTGDFVFVSQNSPYCYSFYNGLVEVLIATDPNYIVVNKLWQGTCQFNQTGTVTVNPELDGTAVVVVSGGSSPNYELVINKTGTASQIVGLTFSGTTRYADNRLRNGVTKITPDLSVFNGAIGHNLWPTYDYQEYNPTLNGFSFLTDLPDNWTVRQENDIYLNYWTGNLTQLYSYGMLEVGGQEYQIVNDGGTPSTVQTVSMGPNNLAECLTVELIPAEVVEWNEQGDWLITAGGNSTYSVTNGALVYDFTGIGGVGRVRARYDNLLTIGQVYEVCVDISLLVGDIQLSMNNGIGLFGTATGEYCTSFTASSTDMIFNMDGNSGTPVMRIDRFSITTQECGLVDCSGYTFSVLHRLRDDRNVLFPLQFPDSWIVESGINATGSISNGTGIYEEITPLAGGGLVTFTQEDVLVPGGNYTYVINVINNSECQVLLGSVGDTITVATANQTGTFSGTFSATAEDFVIGVIGTTASGLNGLDFNNISVVRTDEFVARSERKQLDVDCTCTGRYLNKPMLFLDRMGSLLPVNWTVNHIEQIDITRKGYKKFIGGFNNEKPGFDYTPQQSSYRQFDTRIVEEWELVSNWMTEEESLFLEYTKTSPVVYIQKDDVYVPVRVTDVRYDRVYERNRKLISHRMNIIFNNENNIQTG